MIYVTIWIACAVAAYFIAKENAPKQAPMAACLGLLLGPIGVVAAFWLKDDG